MTEEEAYVAAGVLLGEMDGQGWEHEVWENMGWHYKVNKGGLHVYPAGLGGFFCTLSRESDGVAGCPLWHVAQNFDDPNVAATATVNEARRVVDELNAVVIAAEKATRG